MSIPYASWSGSYPSQAGAAANDSAFVRARQILRQPAVLEIDQFEELDELLRKVGHAEFVALVDDPGHQRQLRRYEALSWRRAPRGPIVLAVLAASLLAVAIVLLLR